MDAKLRMRLERLEEQHAKLCPIVDKVRELEANEKPLFSKLFLAADGKSVAEREAQAYASQDWIDFAQALAHAKSEFINEMRWFEIRQKAYDAEHLTLKTEVPVIKRQGA